MNNSPLSPNASIYVAGHRGMVGSAIIRRLNALGYENIITRTHAELDLTSQADVRSFFQENRLDYVVLAAAKVGGIYANNTYPADFIYSNLMIEVNVVHEAYRAGVQHLLFLGSSCIYPKLAPQPMREEYLLTDKLEPTNEPYAIAKIAGIKLCESYNRQYGTKYRSVMPTNLYGPFDNFDLEKSHVLPALIRKFHLAKLATLGDLEGIKQDEARSGQIPADINEAIGLGPDSGQLIATNPKVIIWGTGKARREFLHVDDMAAASVFVMRLNDDEFDKKVSADLSHINIGSGKDISIKEVAQVIREVVGFPGETIFDTTKPDGTMEKCLDVSLADTLGWQAEIGLRQGLESAYKWYVGN
jgi:GDP-L-fucose synthase